MKKNTKRENTCPPNIEDQQEQFDSFLDGVGEQMKDPIILEGLKEQLRSNAKDELSPVGAGILEKIQAKIATLTGGLAPKLQNFFLSDAMASYSKMVMQTGIDEAEKRVAEILLGVMWGWIDKLPIDHNGKLYMFMTRNRIGRLLTMASILMPLSSTLLARVQIFEERGHDRYAKLCFAISRILSRTLVEEGGTALNLDGLVTMAIDKVVSILDQGGADLGKVVANVSDTDLSLVPTKRHCNSKKMKHRR